MKKWSKEIQKATRLNIYPGAVVKSADFEFGIFLYEGEKIVLKGVQSNELHIPCPTEETVATFDSIDEMIAAGWVID